MFEAHVRGRASRARKISSAVSSPSPSASISANACKARSLLLRQVGPHLAGGDGYLGLDRRRGELGLDLVGACSTHVAARFAQVQLRGRQQGAGADYQNW